MDEITQEEDFSEVLANVRLASRWVAAYQRRVLTYIRAFEAGVQRAAGKQVLEFKEWAPYHYKTVPQKSTPPHKCTGWHFLPFLAVRMHWQTPDPYPQVGSLRVNLNIILDDGWDRRGDSHPDAKDLRDVRQCHSPVLASVYRIVAPGLTSWDELWPLVSSAPRQDGNVHHVPEDNPVLIYRRVSTDLSLLPDRQSVEQRLIEPLAAVLII